MLALLALLPLAPRAGYPRGAACHSTGQCPADHLCLGAASAKSCRRVISRASAQAVAAALPHGSALPAACLSEQWPAVQSCVHWSVDGEWRMCESNDVPPYHVPAYCPFGIGQGYCGAPSGSGDCPSPCNSTDCPPFRGDVCPCVPTNETARRRRAEEGPTFGGEACPKHTPAGGDVLVPAYQVFKFPLNPNPVLDARPIHMYENTALQNGNSYQVIGAHLNGVQIKGPAEANGFNVDTSLIPLNCGGHVTPPVGPGPVYHYHKAADCQNISSPGSHAPLIGYANDGFGIYGFGAFNGEPILDECHGNFGPVPSPHCVHGTEASCEVAYKYHASPVFNLPGEPHKPYYMGCQGPSKGQCNATVDPEYDGGANWCGQGCGYDICVQPGTSRAALLAYLGRYSPTGAAGVPLGPAGAEAWLSKFTVNPF